MIRLHRSSTIPALALPFVLAAACARTPAPETLPERNASVAPGDVPLRRGDCAEARRQLALRPEMTVDRVPEPLAMRPAPFQKAPPTAFNKDGSAVIKVEVMIDTLGRAEMRTFKSVQVSNPWFTANLRSILPRWRFAPATLAGCKVRRVYRFSATVPPRGKKR